METDPESAAVIHFIFQLGSTGISTEAITKELFKKGILTPSQYKAKIREILYDERYIGSYVIGKREVTQIGSKKIRLKKCDKLFIIPMKGKIYCGCCDHALSKTIRKNTFYKQSSL